MVNNNNKDDIVPPLVQAATLDAPLDASSNNAIIDLEKTSRISINDLNFDEKLALVTGKSLWQLYELPRHGLPSLTVSDGPHGLRKPLHELSLHESHPATCFPTACALACSWDRTALKQIGTALRQECLYYDIDVILGPGMNLKRHPCGGRNFEYFSEDPFLTGQLALEYVQGVQATNQVGACIKHFAINNQESHRFVVNALVDERTARELYYSAFETVIKCNSNNLGYSITNSTTRKSLSPPETVMCAYNQVNGQFCSEHSHLLRNILRNEWNYQGVVMTDWGACNVRPRGIAASLDLEMPGSHGVHKRTIKKALKKGKSINESNNDNPRQLLTSPSAVSERSTGSSYVSTSYRIGDDEIPSLTMDELDECAERVLHLVQKYAPVHVHRSKIDSVDWEKHHEIAKQVAMQCVVLLQNKDNLLPLSTTELTSVALIGDFAKDNPRFQGMGSSQVYSERIETAYDYLHSSPLYNKTVSVNFAVGYNADDDDPQIIHQDLIDQAVETAKQSDVVLLFVGLPEIMESEGFDREHIDLPAQHDALIRAVCKVHNKVVVVLSNGGVVRLPWADQPQAILEGYLLGEATGSAMIDLIFGQASPCGKLSETFPIEMTDILADKYFPGTRDVVEYREGLNVGYRYFDSVKKPVRFPFGHGLSYTTFEYTNIHTEIKTDNDFDKHVVVTFDLTNTGKYTAKEVSQCYIHVNDSEVYHPEQELRAFEKIELAPGETKTVTMELSTRAFGFYDVGCQDWVVEPGTFDIRIGSSSRDIRLQTSVTFANGRAASREAVFAYPNDKSEIENVDDIVFSKRFGREESLDLDELNASIKDSGQPFHRNTLLKDLAKKSLLGKFLLWIVYRAASKDFPKGPKQRRQQRMVRANVENLPLRTLVLFSKGNMTFEIMDAFIASANWQFVTSIKKMFTAVSVIIKGK